MKVAILGAAGRMGHILCDLVDKSEELELVAKCDVREEYPRTWPAETEAVIDFTFHEAVPEHITKAAADGVVYVLGTTGLTADEQAAAVIARTATARILIAFFINKKGLLITLFSPSGALYLANITISLLFSHWRGCFI